MNRPSFQTWMRSVVSTWTSIYERLAFDQLPLTYLFESAEKKAADSGTAEAIRIVTNPDIHDDYGILIPPDARLCFRLNLGARPHFQARVAYARPGKPAGHEVEAVVAVAEDGIQRVVWQDVLSVSERRVPARPLRVSIDLGAHAGRAITLVLQARVPKGGGDGVPMIWNTPRLLNRRSLGNQVSRLIGHLRKLGSRGLRQVLVTAMKGQLVLQEQEGVYQLWIEKHSLRAEELREISQRIRSFSYVPTISLITPVYNTDPRWLRKCIESVRNQLYPHWELCLADDASTKGHVGSILREYALLDRRIKAVFSETNHGISHASNRALAVATGDFAGLLDHDDELAPDALYEVVKLLQGHREADIIYSDEDKLEPEGLRSEPFFKPDWSPEYLLSCMYTCHFSVYRKQLIDDVGGFRSAYDGSQDYDLMLRVTDGTGNVFHIPKILYHWRKTAGSAAGSTSAKPYAYTAAKKALAEHLKRRDMKGELLDGQGSGHYRVRHDVDSTNRVSVIVSVGTSSGDARKCVESIRRRTRHPSYEILISVHEGGTTEYSSERTPRSPWGTASSRLRNLAVRETDSPYLLFVEGNTEVITDTWLEALLEFSQQAEIGVVGAKLLSKDGRIRHAGTILGLGADGIAGDPLAGFPADTSYHFGLATDVRNCSAVTGSCMMVRRDVFDRVGGFDEKVPSGFDDLDFCLRVRRQGFRIVWTPYAQLYQHGAAFRDLADAEAAAFMKSRWGTTLLEDPYYNPNLTRDRKDFGIRL
jgi:GT2 family glycosyltransferase